MLNTFLGKKKGKNTEYEIVSVDVYKIHFGQFCKKYFYQVVLDQKINAERMTGELENHWELLQ